MTTTQKKNILILGGSYAGLSTAHYLLRHALPALPDQPSYQVVLVSPAAESIWRQACPRALLSDDMFPQDKIFHDIRSMFAQYPAGSFRFVHGAATSLDHAARTVTVDLAAGIGGSGSNSQEKVLEYHALVIATGASTASPLLGLTRDEKHLRQSWAALRRALPSAKSIVIAGGGPAGVETAGELGEHLNGRAGWFSSRLANPKVPITLVTAAPALLPVLRPEIARSAELLLAKVGVTVIKNARVQSVSPPTAGTDDVVVPTTVTLKDGRVLAADLYIPATGTRPNTGFVTDPALLGGDGRVKTDPATLRVDGAGERVYAIGDASSAFRPAVHLILEAVPALCANIKRDLLVAAATDGSSIASSSLPAEKTYVEDTREAQMVVVGRSRAVGALMGWRLPGWLVWLLKGRDYMLWVSGGLWTGKQWAKEAA
ncbi:uncharacterized protein E0L32_000728 [Thyridium curvatum]|uniref:FAD/NAD(P)-binding domain-containing protein n=1 Tax=Thyridium curvatum TaxID=1093900 RepID=A0A507B695_9PEZI|nr:uncharacterized protein E0L32_000728 [Thyridium curvatum]TPX12551.1 hypothetical protein E0L32_000728 [Thyridium curvatum]